MSSQKTGQPEQETTATDETSLPETPRPVDARQVADYLCSHPDFFEQHRSLLEQLRVPHAADGAISLVERQVAVLREGNTAKQQQLDSLIQIARDNDRLNDQLHQLLLRLLTSTDLTTLLALVSSHLRQDFSADFVALCLLPPADAAFADREEFVEDADAFQGLFQRLLDAGQPHCGSLKPEQRQALFGDRAEAVSSAALLPLGERGRLGLLAIGSAERDRFNAAMDTAFLQRMSETIAAVLARVLKG